jgi:hypothetical protein
VESEKNFKDRTEAWEEESHYLPSMVGSPCPIFTSFIGLNQEELIKKTCIALHDNCCHHYQWRCLSLSFLLLAVVC